MAGSERSQQKIKIISLGAAEVGKVRVLNLKPMFLFITCPELPDKKILREKVCHKIHGNIRD